MDSNASDKLVPREITALLSEERLILRETQRAVTPFDELAVFISFLDRIGFTEALRQHMPIRGKSPNHIEPAATFTAFLIAVLVGARRFAHASLLRGDRELQTLSFGDFGMGHVPRLYEPPAEWQMQHLPRREEGYILDLDSTVFERYGQQEGLLKGQTPRKHGHHHPLLALLSESYFLLDGWLRSGNCGSSRGVEEFLSKKLSRCEDSAQRTACYGPIQASSTTSC